MWLRISIQSAMLAFALLLQGCDKSEKGWAEAEKAHTIEAYQNHINQYQKSEHVEEARKKIESLEWYRVKSQPTISPIDSFCEKFPNSEFSNEASILREELAWKRAKGNDSIEAFRFYLEKYPIGKFAQEAKTIIDEKTKENDIANLEMKIKHFMNNNSKNNSIVSICDIAFGTARVVDGPYYIHPGTNIKVRICDGKVAIIGVIGNSNSLAVIKEIEFQNGAKIVFRNGNSYIFDNGRWNRF